MNLPDFTKYDDEKLEAARLALTAELETRAWKANVPDQIRTMATQYVDAGGSLDDLTLDPPVQPEVPASEPVTDPVAPEDPED